MKWLNLLWTMLCDERGFVMIEGEEENNDNTDGNEDNGGEPKEENKPDPEADPEDKEGEEGQSEESGDEGEEGTPTDPKYGEFGDDPHEAASKAIELINSLKDKGGATEKNLASIRKAAGEVGLSFLRDEEGNVTLQMKEEAKPEVKGKRFTDAHRELVGDDMVEAVSSLFEDMFEAGIVGYEKERTEKREYAVARSNSNAKAFRLYPMARMKDESGNDNPNFNKPFYDRATEIWQANYSKNPKGELMAMHEAAIEMKVSPISLEEAKKAGYNKAKNQKKVLGPAGGGSGSGSKVAPGGVLSQDAYLKLDPEAREKYDKDRMGLK